MEAAGGGDFPAEDDPCTAEAMRATTGFTDETEELCAADGGAADEMDVLDETGAAEDTAEEAA